MTRALVTQLLEALDESRGDVSQCLQEELPKAGYERYDRRIKTIAEQLEKHDAAIKAAREYLANEPSCERAELIAELRERHGKRFVVSPSMFSRAADMLEADAQQANKPTGWDNGLSQDYCAEFGQWLASRPGARQQIKEMFEAGDEPEDLYALALKADNWGQP